MIRIKTFKTKISEGFQTVVPSKIRKKYKLEAHDSVQWKMDDDRVDDDEIIVTFHRKITAEEVTGIIKEKLPCDAVDLRKRIRVD